MAYDVKNPSARSLGPTTILRYVIYHVCVLSLRLPGLKTIITETTEQARETRKEKKTEDRKKQGGMD